MFLLGPFLSDSITTVDVFRTRRHDDDVAVTRVTVVAEKTNVLNRLNTRLIAASESLQFEMESTFSYKN